MSDNGESWGDFNSFNPSLDKDDEDVSVNVTRSEVEEFLKRIFSVLPTIEGFVLS